MRFTIGGRVAAVLAFALSLWTGVADAATRLALKDGREFIGEIVKETQYEVTIRATISGITAEFTFDRSEIAKIEDYQPQTIDPSLLAPKDDPSKDNDAAQPFVHPTYYMEVPITGEIGIDPDTLSDAVTAEGMEDALNFAKRKKIKHVVFVVDSPGGYLREGQRLADVLRQFDGDFTYYAVVRNSISAAMWVTLSCDRIYVLSDGTQGGALSYLTGDSGSPEYDEKRNSIVAKQLASLAQRKGHNQYVAAAMVLPEAEVYLWKDAEGKEVVSDHPAPNTSSAELIDSATSILTLSRRDAERIGFAEPLTGGAKGLGKKLETEKWERLGRYGEQYMHKAAERIVQTEKQRRELVKKIDEAYQRSLRIVDSLPDAVDDAKDKDPTRYSYTIDWDSGLFTAEAMRLWRQRTDDAISAWNRVNGLVGTVVDLESDMSSDAAQMEKLAAYWTFEPAQNADAAMADRQDTKIRGFSDKLKSYQMQANREIETLRANRKRTRP